MPGGADRDGYACRTDSDEYADPDSYAYTDADCDGFTCHADSDTYGNSDTICPDFYYEYPDSDGYADSDETCRTLTPGFFVSARATW